MTAAGGPFPSESPPAPLAATQIGPALPPTLAWFGKLLRDLVVNFGLIVFILALWEIGLHGQDLFQFKPPSAIFRKMYEIWFSGPATSLFLTDAFWRDVVPSVARALGGWALGGVVGIAIGVLAGSSTWVRGYIDPVVSYLRSIPKAALVPTFLIVFGASDTTRVVAIAISTIWLVLLNTLQGVRTLDPVMRDTGRAFHISARRQLTHILLPAASPKIIAGLRVTLSLSLIVMLVSEWLLTDSGLGFYLLDRQRNYDITEMWAALMLLALIGYALNMGFLAVERRLLGWHAGAHSGAGAN